MINLKEYIKDIVIVILIGLLMATSHLFPWNKPKPSPPPIVNNDSLYMKIDSANMKIDRLRLMMSQNENYISQLENEIVKTHSHHSVDDAYAWLDEFRAKHR